jgi:hypothetical protein
MSKIFLIAGDSWACGEWGYNKERDNSLTHPGLGQFMCDHGCLAVNIGIPGGSNSQSAKQVENFLSYNKHLKISAVLVFQTEWSRDIKFQKQDFIQQCIRQGYVFLRDQLIKTFYEELSRSSSTFGIPIWLIGGCSDTLPTEQIDNKFSGLKVLCQSMTNLLLAENHVVSDPVYSYDLSPVTEYKKKFTNIDVEFFIQDIEKGINRQKLWKSNRRYFFPDILHPNRKGHKSLFEFVNQRIVSN